MSEVKITQLDAKEIPRYTYDEKSNAQRVIVINEFQGYQNNAVYGPNERILNAQNYQAPVEKIIETRVETVQVPVIVHETKIERIEVPVYITEYKEIEKTIIVPEVNIIRIPEYITKIEYKEIQVPVVIKEKEIVYVDCINFKMLYIFQAITLGLIVLAKLIK